MCIFCQELKPKAIKKSLRLQLRRRGPVVCGSLASENGTFIVGLHSKYLVGGLKHEFYFPQ